MDFDSTYNKTKAELANVYKPTLDFYNQQIGGLDAAYDPMKQAAEQARVNAFRKIENTANSRGMFFSGQPIANQMEYNYGTYNPALASIDLAKKNRKTSLEETLLKIGTDMDSQARDLTQKQINEYNRALEKQRADAESLRRWNAEQSRLWAAQNSKTNKPYQGSYGLKTNGGGFWFKSDKGADISAGRYAQLSGKPIDELLYEMGQSGDKYAMQVYNQIKQDPWRDQNWATYRKKYSPLFWDVQL